MAQMQPQETKMKRSKAISSIRVWPHQHEVSEKKSKTMIRQRRQQRRAAREVRVAKASR